MKKIIFLLLFSVILNAQVKPDWEYDLNRPIGAFFPSYFPMNTNKYIPTLNTYYEYNWVSNNLRRLIENNFKLKRNNDLNKDSFIIDYYSTSIGQVLEKIEIKYNIFTLYGFYIVNSIEVTGSKLQVAKLFIYLYNDEIQSASLKNGFVKTFTQDYAVYNVVNGIATIKISNTAYKNKNEFRIDFDKFKEKFKTDLMLAKLAEEQRQIESDEYIQRRQIEYTRDSIARKLEAIKTIEDFKKEQDLKPVTSINVYYFAKTGSKLEFKNQPSVEVKKLIIDKVSDYKKGNYSAYVTTTSILDKKTYDIKINQGRN